MIYEKISISVQNYEKIRFRVKICKISISVNIFEKNLYFG